MLYQIILTEEQHTALLHLIERAKAQPENKQNDEIKAIASIKVGAIATIETEYRFTCTYTTQGDHFVVTNPDWDSESFDAKVECMAKMKATMLESAAEEMSSQVFDSANFDMQGDTMRFTMVYGDNTMTQEYKIEEIVSDK
jgi:hypothetical protein